MSSHQSLLLVHIATAVIGLISGFVSMGFKKGSGLHRASGTIFFLSMLLMSSTAAILAGFVLPNKLNLIVGLLTFYLVSTAWWAAKRGESVGPIDAASLVWVSLVAGAAFFFGFVAINSPRGMKDGMPAMLYFIFGSVALACAVSDARLLRRGGITGSPRIVRHLWRMSLALLIATLSFFPGQARQLPLWLKTSSFMYVPHVLLIGSMIYWRVRYRTRKRVAANRRVDTATLARTTGTA